MKHLNIQVFGRVQGVWFRKSTQVEAERLGLNGFVRNEEDGSVHMEVEGKEEIIQELIEWCGHGPDRAQVKKVYAEEGEFRDIQGFSVT